MSQGKQSRLVFLDALRLIAAFQMIQGHSIASVLDPAYRSGWGYAAWSFARGLTSVLFLFTAGFSFALAHASGRGTVGRVRRALKLVVIGYAMHAPLALLFGADRESTLQAALWVDVLHCIGVSLLSLELVARVRRAALVASVLAALAFAAAPLTRDLPLWPRAVANYFTARGGSLFPLLPWSGYLLAGFALGALCLHRRAHIPRWLAGSGAACMIVGLALLRWVPVQPLALSPGYALVKLACTMVLGAAMAWWFRGRSLPPLASRLSRETLFLYVSHVVILYADVVGLAPRLGERHGPWFGVALALSLFGACSAGALFFRSLPRPFAGGRRAPPTP